MRNRSEASKSMKDDVEKQIQPFDSSSEQYSTSEPAKKEPPRKSQRYRHNIFPRGSPLLKLDQPSVDDIFETARNHNCFKNKRSKVTNLEQYNNIRLYGIEEQDEEKLLRGEIDRLVNAANSSEEYLLDFSGQLGIPVQTGFEELGHIADQLSCAMAIVTVDNASISFQHCRNEIQHTADAHRLAHRELRGRFGDDRTGVKGSAPKTLEPRERNDRIYHALVDYISASVARVLAKTATGRYWIKQAFSCLAACTIKLKILQHNLYANADLCLSSAEAALQETTKSNKDRELLVIKLRPRPNDDIKDMDALDSETEASQCYHEEKTLVMRRVAGLFRHVLGELLSSEADIPDQTSFQVHSTIYKSGIDGFPTSLFSARDGEVAASSLDVALKVAYTASELVVKNAQAIDAKLDPEASPANATRIFCQWAGTDGKWASSGRNLLTDSAEQVYSLLIPLSLTSPLAAEEISNMISFAVSAAMEDDPIRVVELPPPDLHATFTISTSDWRCKEERLGKSHQEDPWVQTLPRSPIKPGVRAGTMNLRSSSFHLSRANTPHKAVQERSAQDSDEQLSNYFRKRAEMCTWVIGVDTITVHCRGYVYAVVTVACLVVSCGIAVPFGLGKRINDDIGVDSFQITLFSWILAGFMLLVAKGRYVNEWPWHEFIHGHVVCRSVSELADVSKIDTQTILMYLLLNEWRSILSVRAPYCGMFANIGENGQGFSIDEPVHLSTLIASGFILLKVVNWDGEHLVGLDVRKGADGVCLRTRAKQLVCSNLAEYEELDPADIVSRSDARVKQDGQVKRLRQREIRVERVLGVYIEPCYFG